MLKILRIYSLVLVYALGVLMGGLLYTQGSGYTGSFPNTKPTDPLSIISLRAKEYPGSKLVKEETLVQGSNYTKSIVSYQSEGLKINALLTTPKGDPPPTGWPAVIIAHGDIPPQEYVSTEKYVAHVNRLARNRYVVMMPDYRGHGESEGEAVNAYAVPDYTVDVLNAVSSLKKAPNVDPERIGMWGHPTGGHIMLRVMVIETSIKAGVIWGGVVGSYKELLTQWSGYKEETHSPRSVVTSQDYHNWRSYLPVAYGSPATNSDKWDEISATSYLADLSGPLQLHHSESDEWVPVELSKLLKEKLDAEEKPSELHLYEDDDHNLINNYATAMGRSVRFLDKHLKNVD